LFRNPQIKLILNEELPTPDPSQEGKTPPYAPLKGGIYGRDYTVEQETGTLFVRILPPNVRDISDEHFGNLFALGTKHTPTGFVLIGRPDFTETAYVKARQFASTYSKQVLLYPAYEICERYVRTLEGTAEFQLN
jgi:hypothetical protein